MLRCLEVSGLPRPARLRCRPTLIRAIGYRGYGMPARRPTEEESVPRLGPAAAQYEDYQLALKHARAAGRSTKQEPKRRSKLPSLANPDSFRKGNDGHLADAAGPNTQMPTPRPSRKGKEKAIEPIVADPVPTGTRRKNAVGVQLLSESLHQQLFPGPSLPKPPNNLLAISKDHLKLHGLSPEGAAVLPEISFDMPPLQGSDLREHFFQVGTHMADPYYTMAKELLEAKLPPMPEKWELQTPGWTKYDKDGSWKSVKDLGDERVVSFDVETLWKLSQFPVMATAVTPNGWYSWLCPTIFDSPPDEIPPAPPRWQDRVQQHHPHDLIPLFSGTRPSLVIGHNVGYDRARIQEEYSLGGTKTRFMDTLALHVATRGITSVQRPAWMKHKKNKLEKLTREAEAIDALKEQAEQDGDLDFLVELGQDNTADDAAALQKRWEDVTSMNSLAEVASLHCGYPVDKSIRSRFSDESIKHASELRPELNELLTYCANDVRITHDVYKKVLPLFLESCPHPASFAGVLTMGSSFLPVNESWKEYLRNAEAKYKEMDEGVRKALKILAEKARSEGVREGDPWSTQLDWTPKAARWPDEQTEVETTPVPAAEPDQSLPPAWFKAISDRAELTSNHSQRNLLPLLLRMSYKGHPVACTANDKWCFKVPHGSIADHVEIHGAPVELSAKDEHLELCLDTHAFLRISTDTARKVKLNGPSIKKLLKSGELTSPYPDLLERLSAAKLDGLEDELWKCAESMLDTGGKDDWGMQLDWSRDVDRPNENKAKAKAKHGTWPKWYYDLTAPESNDKVPFGELDLTMKKSVSPLLLRLQWQGYPLVISREYKWLYKVPKTVVASEIAQGIKARGDPVRSFASEVDEGLASDHDHYYYRLPHKDGEGKNVGNPLSKAFVKAIESKELSSASTEDGDDTIAKAATDATNMNVLCSYWISSRERIMDQMVVYQNETAGMILPQVITMGTVTRRAVEATWLTAANAKKNRVGSELKAMVRAPAGYSIVGADVDSEELWISSVMGDSQFGMHGATAIGWMTLEGTKSAGTDLHSKTAGILGTSRDAAKVFNYSRIYGAGQKHAVQLLMQGDSTLTKEKANKLAVDLYKATKGSRTFRAKTLKMAATPSIWHGGSESYLFNTLEAIALNDRPTTPALGCGVTRALRKSYLETASSYLPSRINWVVQSSGVDYLHLLIVSMEYLIKKYDIKARYLISVHDEVRYLAKEEDRYRTALALQVANAWTRGLFCYNLSIDNLPQGVTFFSAVDVDHVLRKEVFMTCETPSHPSPIPAGESLDIEQLLLKTSGGDLGPVVIADPPKVEYIDQGPPVSLFPDIKSDSHRLFCVAQAYGNNQRAKRWLDGQVSLGDDGGEGEVLPVKPKVKLSRQTKLRVAQKVKELDARRHWEDQGEDVVDWHEVDLAYQHVGKP